jgi:hypothetical protein
MLVLATTPVGAQELTPFGVLSRSTGGTYDAATNCDNDGLLLAAVARADAMSFAWHDQLTVHASGPTDRTCAGTTMPLANAQVSPNIAGAVDR